MAIPISIRRAFATDLPTVYAGELDYIRQIEPAQESRWRNAMQAHIKQWTHGLERMFTADSAGQAIGYCFWEPHGEAAVLASIYVLPDQRGAGLGKRLLTAYIADAQTQGFSRLTLGVKADNPARKLYEGEGFIYTHDEGGYRHYAMDAQMRR